ncbi:hypothetical protein LR48_Vigan08g075700 [Vigna angularis]|uniref:Uncharacterized protein n=1 Tax=Phaseolus angularis TaxID=3914 RepID=A0A0L9V4E3_PHAAN|nr:hypothetical protein LR48_Vigan08g075700 [Vigna angularis]
MEDSKISKWRTGVHRRGHVRWTWEIPLLSTVAHSSLLRSLFRHHRRISDVVSFILDRTVPDSETEGDALLEDVIEEENLVDIEVKAEP